MDQKDEKIRIWIRNYTFKKVKSDSSKKEEISTSHHQSLKVNVVHIWYFFALKLRFHDYRTIIKNVISFKEYSDIMIPKKQSLEFNSKDLFWTCILIDYIKRLELF